MKTKFVLTVKILIIILIAIIAVHWKTQAAHSQTNKSFTNADYALLDTHGKIPGNPERTIQAMHRLYKLTMIYRKHHDGALPIFSQDPSEDIVHDLYAHWKEYGLQSAKEVDSIIYSPDSRFMSDFTARANAKY